MTARIRTTTALGLLALASALVASLPGTAAGALSPAGYGVGPVCQQPAPGYAGCLGLRLIAREPRAVRGARPLAHGSPEQEASAAVEYKEPFTGSLGPQNVRTAYGLTATPPPAGTQTIALVDAYDDATAEADLEHFDAQFGLPPCNEANGCFRKVNQEGHPSPLPPSSGSTERGWAQEIATDVEVAHGICRACHMLLVEAKSDSFADLLTAENTAAHLGATEISDSWGGEEPPSGGSFADSSALNHPGVVVTASSGDNGYRNWMEAGEAADYPATSPHVVAVGGTHLFRNGDSSWAAETVWNDGGESGGFVEGNGASGGGCSNFFTAQPWQQAVADWTSVGCASKRSVADVAADADPYTGVAVYDSTENPYGESGWGVIGGTSVSSPIIASVFALAGGAQGIAYPARTLYENVAADPAALHDVTVGSNGECTQPFEEVEGTSGCSAAEEAASCHGARSCLAGTGYDGPTGLGTPDGIGAFVPSAPGGSGGGGTGGETSSAPSGVASPGGSAAGGSAAGGAGGSSSSVVPLVPTISGLGLTRGALIALNRARPKISRVAFAFTVNMVARVRGSLAKLVRVHGHLRWRTVGAAFTISAHRGRQSHHLTSGGVLKAGRYELTLTPRGGRGDSFAFEIAG
jgi:hypothetical protein